MERYRTDALLFTDHKWRAGCGETCKSGSEGGQRDTRRFRWDHVSYLTGRVISTRGSAKRRANWGSRRHGFGIRWQRLSDAARLGALLRAGSYSRHRGHGAPHAHASLRINTRKFYEKSEPRVEMTINADEP